MFRYSVGARNELNTFNITYTKDMVKDPLVTVKLSLSEEEPNRVYQKMIEFEFLLTLMNFLFPRLRPIVAESLYLATGG